MFRNSFLIKVKLLVVAFSLFGMSGKAQEHQVVKVTNETFKVLKDVSNSALADGEVLLSLTTHQDLGWIDEIEKCVVMRDTQWITPFLQRLRDEAAFEMDVEQASIMREYITRHPDKKEEIVQRLKEGRMLVGATHNQPYEEMYFSESLARQFYLGKLWLKNEFEGYNATSYYNSDVPGRSLQMPQLLAKAGVENMFISRHGRGVFDWKSPDGSSVTSYSPGHYIDFYNVLGKENDEAIKELGKQALYWTTEYDYIPGEKAVMPAVLNFEFIWDPKPVHNLDPFMKLWNNLATIENEDGERLEVSIPKIKFSTLDKFFDQMRQGTKELPSIMGERPNVWVYIHGPSHHWALDHSRKADVLLPAAEKFAMADVLVSKSYANYPIDLFAQAWESKIYPDHGWGGKGGQSTDDIFLARFADAHAKAQYLLDNSLNSLASKVATDQEKGVPVVVFNSLSWERTSPVQISMKFNAETARSVRLFSKSGEEIPVQLSQVVQRKDGYLKSAELCFVASNVPSIGYETYYAQFSDEPLNQPALTFNPTFENDFFEAQLADGGLSSLLDKKLNKELVDDQFFKAGEIFTTKSEGNGAGEFFEVQQVSMDGFDKTGNYPTAWELVADGPVYTSFRYRQPIRNAVAELQITFYNNVKKVDFDVELKNWDGTMFREYRMALPLKLDDGKVAYEVPFGVVEVGKDEMTGIAGNGYETPCKELHPRGIENWINASGTGFGVTLSSSVVGMDYVDPTGKNLPGTILQPILLASRRSCHGEGNDYHQTGDHRYSFSITSHQPGWKNGFRFGKESNEALFAVVAPEKYRHAPLPERGSFLSIDQDNIVVTAMKKAENEDGMVVRCYNLDGQQTTAKLKLWEAFDTVYETNLIEENKVKLKGNRSGTVKLDLGKYEIKTIKLK